MKFLFLILIAIAIVAGGYIYLKNSERPVEPQPSENQVVELEPEPLSIPEPEVVLPEPSSEPILPKVDFALRAADAYTTLTDKQGRKIQAKVLSVTGDQIKLRRDDGLETSIPLSMLSETDIAYCEYLRDNASQVAEIPSAAKSTPQGSLDPRVMEAQGGIDWDAIFGE